MAVKVIKKPIAISCHAQNSKLGVLGFKKINKDTKEQVGFRGIRHLSEHLICCAWDDMSEYFLRYGINHNAYTSNNHMTFYFQGLEKYVEKIVDDILLRKDKNMFGFIPNKDIYERELKVVMQEYEGYMSKPYNALSINLLRKYYRHSGPIGTYSDLQDMTYDKFIPFFMEQKHFDEYIRVGEYNRNTDIAMLAHYDYSRYDNGYTKIESRRPYIEYKEDKVDIEYTGSSSGQTIIADWIQYDETVEPWEAAMVSELLDGGVGSPLLKVLREEHGLAYTANLNVINPVVPALISYVTVNPSNVDKARNLLHDTYINWEKYITRDRFNSAIAGVHIQNELSAAKNYSIANIEKLHGEVGLYPTNNLVGTFTYERACNILSKFFIKENIRIAQVDKEIII